MRNSPRKHPAFTLPILGLIFALIVVISMPATALAQDTGTLARTGDGNLSIQLPQGWAFVDKTNDTTVTYFLSQLYFSASPNETEARYQSFAGSAAQLSFPGGYLALINPPDFQAEIGATPDAANVLDFFVGTFEQNGVTMLASPEDIGDLAIGGHQAYGAAFDATTTSGHTGFIVTLDTPLGVVVAGTTAPSDVFEANSQQMADMLDTINAPAATTTSGTGLGNPSTNGSGLGSDTTPQVYASTNGEVSVKLPPGWITEDHLQTENSAWIFGDSAQAVETRFHNFAIDENAPISGLGGVVVLFSLAADLQAPAPLPAGYVTSFLEDRIFPIVQGASGTILGQVAEFGTVGTQAALFNYEYPTTGQRGLFAAAAFEEAGTLGVIIVSAPDTATYDANFDLLAGIIDTLRVPGEPATATTPGLGDPQAPSSGLPGLGRGKPNVDISQPVSDSLNSFVLGVPSGWLTQEDSGVVYFGVDQASIDGFIAGTSQPGPAGGALIQNKSAFENGANATLEELFNQILADSSDSIISRQTGFAGTAPAFWAEGTYNDLHGYWVIVDFGARVGIMIVITPETNWKVDQALLQAIFQSFKLQ